MRATVHSRAAKDRRRSRRRNLCLCRYAIGVHEQSCQSTEHRKTFSRACPQEHLRHCSHQQLVRYQGVAARCCDRASSPLSSQQDLSKVSRLGRSTAGDPQSSVELSETQVTGARWGYWSAIVRGASELSASGDTRAEALSSQIGRASCRERV